ncbi:AAA family ATPase [Chondromyces apiculatus]|uniref:ATPase AAA-type core domain-containing protein n=1 Tax=Chondromyces apiculatus DSM 436 TaxID=1192034 RepID=A0A017STV0_9BACT|nr:AAA family ATPase [Chondromyces apiculatus]EYF00394.1 Hypothetical protein CAP_0878 [Chondromyces apiculatus DSM 436]
MALASYTAANYRSFADATEVELRPLTLLFGYNSAGKSALLRVLPLLAASTDPSIEGPLALRSAPARDATFNDLRSRLTSKPSLDFALSWDDDQTPVKRVEISILDLFQSKRQVVDQLRAFGADGTLLLEAHLALTEDSPGADVSRYDLQHPDGSSTLASIDFEGLVPSLPDEALKGPQADVLRAIAQRLKHLRTSVHWIGSMRTLPPRRSSYTGPPRRIQPDGEGTSAMLAYDALADGAVLKEVSDWYAHAMAHRLEIVREGAGQAEQFFPALSPLQGEAIRIHLIDTGEGMAQVLPVIVLGALARHGKLGMSPTLGIEQPELHLHPRAHAEVASFLCGIAASEDPPRILLETHSENLLLRVQLAIIRGELPPGRVLVYWVRQTAEGHTLMERITFDELARPENNNWPPGVFSEDVEQARSLILERRKRSQA